ncbi:MAG: hypothetical protein NZ853_09080 [Leptospiraceae bacterium]|nr:hypothetical protein [Leptospiraceae bacterium]
MLSMNLTYEYLQTKIKKIIQLFKESNYPKVEEELNELSYLFLEDKEKYVKKEDFQQLFLELKQGFQHFHERFSEILNYSNIRFEEINKRFEVLNKRFDDQRFFTKEYFENQKFLIEKHFEVVNKRLDDIKDFTEKRFLELKDFTEKRFLELKDFTEKRFLEAKESSDKRFEEINRRFEDMNKRFSFLQWFISFLFSVLVGILTFFYYQHLSLTKEILKEIKNIEQQRENLDKNNFQKNK